MLGKAWRALRSLLFPVRCYVCGEEVSDAAHGICTMCRYNIPLTYFWLTEDNPTRRHLEGLFPLEQASSFYFFTDGSAWRTLIHRFKYGSEWRLARKMGLWYGTELRSSRLYDDVDIIVPVPLHYRKRLGRGYNQSHYIAEGMAEAMGIEVEARTVRRVRNNPPQALSDMHTRWKNVEGIFEVADAERLRGRHILLVDDVLTTGATLSSCASAIIEAAPDCRISIATLAVTHKVTTMP